MGPDRFGLFIEQWFILYNSLRNDPAGDRQQAIRVARRALAVLRNYRPGDEGQEILIETAIEQFEDLIRRAGGAP